MKHIKFIILSIILFSLSSCSEKIGDDWVSIEGGRMFFHVTLDYSNSDVFPNYQIESYEMETELELGLGEKEDLFIDLYRDEGKSYNTLAFDDFCFVKNTSESSYNLKMNHKYMNKYTVNLIVGDGEEKTNKKLVVYLDFYMKNFNDGGNFEITSVTLDGKQLEVIKSANYEVPLSGKVWCIVKI